MCDVFKDAALWTLLLLFVLFLNGVAYGFGGYMVKWAHLGFVTEPKHGSEDSTPRELRHFWDFNQEYAWTAVIILDAGLLAVAGIVFVLNIGIRTVSMCFTLLIKHLIVQPLMFWLCGTRSDLAGEQRRERPYSRLDRRNGNQELGDARREQELGDWI
jgi:hypothetical protein